MRLLCLAALLLAGPACANDQLPASAPIQDAVDHYIDLALKEQEVRPAAPLDDAAFLRRATLDLVGRIPTVGELDAYLTTSAPGKKLDLVERLLNSGGFVRHQVNELEALLMFQGGGRRSDGSGLRSYLTRVVKENRGWDGIFRDLLLADEKDPGQKGAAQFLKSRVKDLDRLTTDVSVLFFGVNISCAQCHDHPLVPDWKQDHYYGMQSFLARTYEAGPFLAERDAGVVSFKTTKNETKKARLMFLTGKALDAPGSDLSPEEEKKLREAQKKRPKGDKAPAAPPPAPKFSARRALVELALQPDQRDFFARAVVNRLWQRFLGLGLVTPLDQMHPANLASHPELLDWLARDTAAHGYDLKRLIRGLVLSRAYARSSRWDGEPFPPARSFAVARLRALTPLQLATSLRLATANPETFPQGAAELERKLEDVEGAVRGLAGLFEQPREDFQVGVSEALLFSNNERLQRELLAGGRDRLVGRMEEMKDSERAIHLAIRTVLTREPAPDEKQALLGYLAARKDRPQQAYRQIVWALLTSPEFRFNH